MSSALAAFLGGGGGSGGGRAAPNAPQKGRPQQHHSRSPPPASTARGGKQQQPCIFYARGNCRDGAACRFAHIDAAAPAPAAAHDARGGGGGGKQVCRNFAATGTCQFGNSCRFEHAAAAGAYSSGHGGRGGAVQHAPSGLFASAIAPIAAAPRMPGPHPSSAATRDVCKQYLAGHCRYGDRCRFAHEGVPLQAAAVHDPRRHESNSWVTPAAPLSLFASARPSGLFAAHAPGYMPLAAPQLTHDVSMGAGMPFLTTDVSMSLSRMASSADAMDEIGTVQPLSHGYQQAPMFGGATMGASKGGFGPGAGLGVNIFMKPQPGASAPARLQTAAPPLVAPAPALQSLHSTAAMADSTAAPELAGGVDQLSAEALEQFKAERFSPGRVPETPPPIAMCT